ncbi:hypothetical protein [Lapidilactobacillus gannanensis]|uniref:Uncharacterized protein n=1 Tax=Lapidilactobacillus gannanensis TaxID=2486002 RepID=A0ABW4BJV6_9LACO|nr:hypothetical protein [Lapidilactobacillus gannanensis]
MCIVIKPILYQLFQDCGTLLGYDLSTLGDALYGNLRPLCNQITLGSYSFMNNTIMSQVKFY